MAKENGGRLATREEVRKMVNSHSLRINKRTIDFNKKLTNQTKTFLIENCALVGGQSFVAVGDETCKDWVCIGAEIENGVGVYPG